MVAAAAEPEIRANRPVHCPMTPRTGVRELLFLSELRLASSDQMSMLYDVRLHKNMPGICRASPLQFNKRNWPMSTFS